MRQRRQITANPSVGLRFVFRCHCHTPKQMLRRLDRANTPVFASLPQLYYTNYCVDCARHEYKSCCFASRGPTSFLPEQKCNQLVLDSSSFDSCSFSATFSALLHLDSSFPRRRIPAQSILSQCFQISFDTMVFVPP